jgi:CHAT domain-containing protein
MKKIGLLVITFFCFTSAIGQSTSYNIDLELQKCNEAYYHSDLDRCIQIAQQALSYMDSLSIKKPSAYVMLHNRIGLSFYAKGKYDESFQNALRAREYIKADSDNIEIIEYVLTTQLLTGEYRRTGDAEKLRDANLELLKTLEGSNDNGLGESYSRVYLATIYDLAASFINIGRLDVADSLTIKAYYYINSNAFSFSALNAECVFSIAGLLYQTNISYAKQLDNMVLQNINDLIHHSSVKDIIVYNPTSPTLLSLPITSYVRLGQKDQALDYSRWLHEEVKDFCKPMKYNVGVGDYINASYLYIPCFAFFSDEGYLGEAFSVLQSMYVSGTLMENVSKETDVFRDRITMYSLAYLSYQSLYLKSMGDYQSALNNDTVALNYVIGLSNYQPTVEVANRLYTVSRTYKRLNNVEASLNYLYMAADAYEKALGASSSPYFIASSECLYDYFKNGFFLNSAEDLIDSCMKEVNANDINVDNRYDWGLLNISKCYMLLRQYDAAYKYLTVIGNRKDAVVDKILILESELECLINMGLYNLTSSILLDLFNARKDQIRLGFTVMPGNYRSRFWNEISYSFLETIPITSYSVASDSNIICATNALLLSKGVLLNTEQNLHETIISSKDSMALSWYDSISFYMGLLKQLDTMSSSKTKYSPDYLRIEILKAEQQLSNRAKAFGDITRDMSIEWTDVKKQLNSNEAAIEFNSFTTDNDTTIYVAYVIRPQWTAPKQVVLAKLTKGESLSTNNLYSNSRLSRVIWEELSTTLDGAKTIYFAPTGELYNIAIESLPDYEDSTRLISDRYNLYRLSSTRELAKDKKKAYIKNCSIYGGLRYDATIDTTLRGADGQRSFTYFPWNSDSISVSRGNNAEFLPGTLAEAMSIYDFMRRASIKTKMFTDSLGTEFSFKQMSGSDVNVIQIGTHGFYYEGKQEAKSERESIVGEDKSMTRSGLLLAGANMTLENGMPNTSTYNDGILTASEIAQLDLKNVDMVVLSACESGLGELKGDGVFGLQRGFKKAGVNSIIMSLWKVDDRATQMLMTQFYENWLIKKMSKQKALKAAQEYVRNYEVDKIEWAIEQRKQRGEFRGSGGTFRSKSTTGKSKKTHDTGQMFKPYQDPKYWAAFILLDGLD